MPRQQLVTENGVVAQTLLNQDTTEGTSYDVIVVGSVMGGGVVASALADAGKKVLVLEAGSLLFPTHIGNLPRRLLIGRFSKHIWSLWNDFQVINYTPVDQQGIPVDINDPELDRYRGAQGFNLGGRSIFWGSSIPPLAAWELEAWPATVREYLEDQSPQGGYAVARDVLNANVPVPSPFQVQSRNRLDQLLQDWNAQDAPVGVEYAGATNWSIPAGIFSTADLLIEDQLVQDLPNMNGPDQREPLTVNLNHAVWNVNFDDQQRATGVFCDDLFANKKRTYTAKGIVLSAGTVETPKIALQSNIQNAKIGRGITDHTIMYRHFVIPPNPLATDPAAEREIKSAKVLIKHPAATKNAHAFDIIVELGAEFNQGRYIDAQLLAQDINIRNGYMLCEIVFQFYSPLIEAHYLATQGRDPVTPVNVYMEHAQPDPVLVQEAIKIATKVLRAYGALKVSDPGERNLYDVNGNVILETAAVGGVAHEVGSMRMSGDGSGVVDANLKVESYENLFVCDNSVFSVSPCGNPSLTLVALAKRLATYITETL